MMANPNKQSGRSEGEKMGVIWGTVIQTEQHQNCLACYSWAVAYVRFSGFSTSVELPWKLNDLPRIGSAIKLDVTLYRK